MTKNKFVKAFAHYCQKCRAGNAAGEEFCLKCGTPLMLVVTTIAARHENDWHNSLQAEHLLERISVLEVRLMQVTDKLSDILDLVLRQSKIVQNEHALVETVMDALTASGIVEKGEINQMLREKQERNEKENAAIQKREAVCEKVLAFGDNTKIDLFTHLVKEGFKQINLGDENQGLRTLERAIAIAPDNLPLLAFLGKFYFHIDKRNFARNHLQRARQFDSKNATVNLLLGIILADDGDYDAAKNLLENCDNGEPVFTINYLLGMIYAAQNDFDKTLVSFKNILASNPSAEANYLTACAYFQMQRPKMTMRYLQKAVESDENFADAWYLLGVCYLAENDQSSAQKALKMAVEAHDNGSQCQVYIKNSKKQNELKQANLLFAFISNGKKNLINKSAPRFQKIIREEIETI